MNLENPGEVQAYLTLLGMIWGSSFLFQRITVPVLGAPATAGLRTVLAALFLAGLLALLRRPLNWRQRWRDYVTMGFFSAGVPFLLFAYAAHYLPAGYSAVLNATVPLFAVLLGWLSGPRPSASKLIGVVVGMVGVATLVRFGVVEMSWVTAAAFAGLLIASLMYAIGARAWRKIVSPAPIRWRWHAAACSARCCRKRRSRCTAHRRSCRRRVWRWRCSRSVSSAPVLLITCSTDWSATPAVNARRP